MVSTPSVTVPSDAEISTEFRVQVVLGFTAPSNRHLKHVRTPPSTVITSKLAEILKVSTHSVCELTVEIKGETKGILQISHTVIMTVIDSNEESITTQKWHTEAYSLP